MQPPLKVSQGKVGFLTHGSSSDGRYSVACDAVLLLHNPWSVCGISGNYSIGGFGLQTDPFVAHAPVSCAPEEAVFTAVPSRRKRDIYGTGLVTASCTTTRDMSICRTS